MTRKNNFKFWIIFCAILMLALGAITIAKYWHRLFPSHEVSQIYARYENVEGIDASFIKDFRVNDTVFVDVTLLEAKDSAGWEILCHDFAISDIIPLLQQINKNMIITQLVNKYDYTQVVDSSFSDPEMMAFSYTDKAITIFHIENKNEILAVCYHNCEKSIQNQVQKSTH